MTDRLYLASEVTRRLNYLRDDTNELGRLLRDETLSLMAAEQLDEIIDDLRRISGASRPIEKAHAAE